MLFTNSAPQGRVGQEGGMAVYMFIPFPCNLFPGISLVNTNGRSNQVAAGWQDQPGSRRLAGSNRYPLKQGGVWIGLDFMVSVPLSASVERVGVSRMRDFWGSFEH